MKPRVFDDLVAIGRVIKPQGRKGEVLVEPLSDRPERFPGLRAAFLPGPGGGLREIGVERSWPHKGKVVLKLKGVDSIDDAERLRGLELRIPEDELAELPAGSYYHHQLVGLRVSDASGRELGEVASIWETGGEAPVLVVRGAGGETLVPLAESIVPAIDLQAGTLRVQWPSDPDAGAAASPAAATVDGGTPAPLRIDVVTIFPGMFPGTLGDGIVRRAIDAGLVTIHVHDLRDFTSDRHRQVDDRAFGGGPGMVMKAEPFFRAVESLFPQGRAAGDALLLLSPRGRRFEQRDAARLAGLRRIVLLCGRYEGIDERVRAGLQAEELSLGDFVLTGGEVAALAVIEAAVRLLPGALGDEDSAAHDSFSDGLLDWPHYTRPAEVRGLRVPEVLLSGHHERVQQWRRDEALEATRERRPDLLAAARPTRQESGDTARAGTGHASRGLESGTRMARGRREPSPGFVSGGPGGESPSLKSSPEFTSGDARSGSPPLESGARIHFGQADVVSGGPGGGSPPLESGARIHFGRR